MFPFWRHAEMGRAVVQRLLPNNVKVPSVVYGGLFSAEQKDAQLAIEGMVYNWWDGSSNAPARSRPQEAKPDPVFQLLSWSNGACIFPEAVQNKFPSGSVQHQGVMALKEKMKEICPQLVDGSRKGASGSAPVTGLKPRAGGRPDYAIEGGTEPLDWQREVDLVTIPAASFSEPKLLESLLLCNSTESYFISLTCRNQMISWVQKHEFNLEIIVIQACCVRWAWQAIIAPDAGVRSLHRKSIAG